MQQSELRYIAACAQAAQAFDSRDLFAEPQLGRDGSSPAGSVFAFSSGRDGSDAAPRADCGTETCSTHSDHRPWKQISHSSRSKSTSSYSDCSKDSCIEAPTYASKQPPLRPEEAPGRVLNAGDDVEEVELGLPLVNSVRSKSHDHPVSKSQEALASALLSPDRGARSSTMPGVNRLCQSTPPLAWSVGHRPAMLAVPAEDGEVLQFPKTTTRFPSSPMKSQPSAPPMPRNISETVLVIPNSPTKVCDMAALDVQAEELPGMPFHTESKAFEPAAEPPPLALESPKSRNRGKATKESTIRHSKESSNRVSISDNPSISTQLLDKDAETPHDHFLFVSSRSCLKTESYRDSEFDPEESRAFLRGRFARSGKRMVHFEETESKRVVKKQESANRTSIEDRRLSKAKHGWASFASSLIRVLNRISSCLLLDSRFRQTWHAATMCVCVYELWSTALALAFLMDVGNGNLLQGLFVADEFANIWFLVDGLLTLLARVPGASHGAHEFGSDGTNRKKVRASDRRKRQQAGIGLVRKLPMFMNSDAQFVTKLCQAAELQIVERGQIICEEGKEGTALLVIVSGEAESKQDSIMLTKLGEGGHIGESNLVGLVDTYMCTLVATSTCEVLTIERAVMRKITEDFPQEMQQCKEAAKHLHEQMQRKTVAMDSEKSKERVEEVIIEETRFQRNLRKAKAAWQFFRGVWLDILLAVLMFPLAHQVQLVIAKERKGDDRSASMTVSIVLYLLVRLLRHHLPLKHLRHFFDEQETRLYVDIRLKGSSGSSWVNVKIILVVLGWGHFVGCLHLAVGLLTPEDPTGLNDSLLKQYENTTRIQGFRFRSNEGQWKEYMVATYIAFNQNVEGLAPQRHEVLLLMILTCLGLLVMKSYVIGTFFKLQQTKRDLARPLQVLMESVDTLCQTYDLPPSLRKAIRVHFQYQYSKARDVGNLGEVLRQLPSDLQRKVKEHEYMPVMNANEVLFSGVSHEFLVQLVSRLEQWQLQPSEVVFTEGEAPRELCFLEHGTLMATCKEQLMRYVRSDRSIDNTAIGEVSFLMNMPHLYSVRVRSGVEATMLRISKASFEELVANSPEEDQLLHNVAQSMRLTLSGEDIKVDGVGGDYEETELFQHFHEEVRKVLIHRTSEMQTMFNFAASEGNLEAVETMLRKKICVDMVDYDKRTALHLAASDGREDVVAALIKAEANVNLEDRWGATPLRNALKGKYQAVTVLLKKCNATMQLEDPSAELCSAATDGNILALQELLEVSVDPNSGDYDKRTALHLAASEGMLEVISFLLSKSADPNVKDRWGGTPLEDAIKNGHTVCAQLIHSKGGHLRQELAAGWLCEAASDGNILRLKMLVENSVDVNTGDYDYRTALHLAAAEGQLLAVSLLTFAAQANLSAEDRWCRTALNDAIHCKDRECANLLISAGAVLGSGSSKDDREKLRSFLQDMMGSGANASVERFTTTIQQLHHRVSRLTIAVTKGRARPDIFDVEECSKFNHKVINRIISKEVVPIVTGVHKLCSTFQRLYEQAVVPSEKFLELLQDGLRVMRNEKVWVRYLKDRNKRKKKRNTGQAKDKDYENVFSHLMIDTMGTCQYLQEILPTISDNIMTKVVNNHTARLLQSKHYAFNTMTQEDGDSASPKSRTLHHSASNHRDAFRSASRRCESDDGKISEREAPGFSFPSLTATPTGTATLNSPTRTVSPITSITSVKPGVRRAREKFRRAISLAEKNVEAQSLSKLVMEEVFDTLDMEIDWGGKAGHGHISIVDAHHKFLEIVQLLLDGQESASGVVKALQFCQVPCDPVVAENKVRFASASALPSEGLPASVTLSAANELAVLGMFAVVMSVTSANKEAKKIQKGNVESLLDLYNLRKGLHHVEVACRGNAQRVRKELKWQSKDKDGHTSKPKVTGSSPRDPICLGKLLASQQDLDVEDLAQIIDVFDSHVEPEREDVDSSDESDSQPRSRATAAKRRAVVITDKAKAPKQTFGRMGSERFQLNVLRWLLDFHSMQLEQLNEEKGSAPEVPQATMQPSLVQEEDPTQEVIQAVEHDKLELGDQYVSEVAELDLVAGDTSDENESDGNQTEPESVVGSQNMRLSRGLSSTAVTARPMSLEFAGPQFGKQPPTPSSLQMVAVTSSEHYTGQQKSASEKKARAENRIAVWLQWFKTSCNNVLRNCLCGREAKEARLRNRVAKKFRELDEDGEGITLAATKELIATVLNHALDDDAMMRLAANGYDHLEKSETHLMQLKEFFVVLPEILDEFESLQKRKEKRNQETGFSTESQTWRITRRLSRLVVAPDAAWLARWDACRKGCCIFYLLEVPARFCLPNFDVIEEDWARDLMIANGTIDGFMILSLALNFFRGFRHGSGFIVTDFHQIRTQYLLGWFFVDLVATVPFQLFVDPMHENMRVYAAWRLLKLLHLRHLMISENQKQSDDSGGFLHTAVLVILRIIAMMHVLGCIYWLLGHWVHEQNMEDDAGWFTTYDGMGLKGTLGDKDTPIWSQYIAALYSVTCTITSNETYMQMPSSWVELFWLMVMFVAAMSAVGFLDGTLVGMVISQNKALIEQQVISRRINSFLKASGLPIDLAGQIRAVSGAGEGTSGKPSAAADPRVLEEILQQMPHALRQRLARRVFLPRFEGVKLLRNCSEAFVLELLTHCRVLTTGSGAYVARIGEPSSAFLVFNSGMVQVRDNQDYVLDTVETSGMVFGGITCIFGLRFAVSVLTVKDCSFFKLTRDAYDEVAKLYPADVQQVMMNVLKMLPKDSGERRYYHDEQSLKSAVMTKSADWDAATRARTDCTRGSSQVENPSQVPAEILMAHHGLSMKEVSTVRGKIQAVQEKEKQHRVCDFVQLAAKGMVDAMDTLFKAGKIEVNKGDYDNRTALHIAVCEGHLKVVRKLVLEFKANVMVVDRFGNTPLQDAVREQRRREAEFLVDQGASLPMGIEAATQLCEAAATNNWEQLALLLEVIGMDPNLGDYDKRTALHLAASNGHLECTRCLADFEGINLSVLDRFEQTPLDDAIRHNHVAVQQFLRNNGAQMGKIDFGVRLCELGATNDHSKLRQLIQSGVNPNMADYDNRTAFHLAASNGCLETVAYMLREAKVDPNPLDRYMNTPLDDAKRHGHLDVSALLERWGGMCHDDPSLEVARAASLEQQDVDRHMKKTDMIEKEMNDIGVEDLKSRLKHFLTLLEDDCHGFVNAGCVVRYTALKILEAQSLQREQRDKECEASAQMEQMEMQGQLTSQKCQHILEEMLLVLEQSEARLVHLIEADLMPWLKHILQNKHWTAFLNMLMPNFQEDIMAVMGRVKHVASHLPKLVRQLRSQSEQKVYECRLLAVLSTRLKHPFNQEMQSLQLQVLQLVYNSTLLNSTLLKSSVPHADRAGTPPEAQVFRCSRIVDQLRST